jgi:hypothetical protein
MTGHMSKFTLLCQAGQLLGQVLHHLASDIAIHNKVWVQLDHTLQSMLAAALNIDCPDYDQITFVYRFVNPLLPVDQTDWSQSTSALVALHTPWLAPDQAADPHSN